MATITKRVGKRGAAYLVQVRKWGYTETATLTTREEARNWAVRTEAEILQGHGRFASPHSVASDCNHTLGDAVDRFVRDICPTKRPNTARMYRQQLVWWKAQLGACELRKLTPSMVAQCRDALASTHNPTTVVAYCAALRACLEVAVREWDWLAASPLRKVNIGKPAPGRRRYLSDEERQRLLDACRQSHNRQLYTLVMVALSTGARREELLSVQWSQIDVNRGTISLTQTKNKEPRTTPLVGPALALLRTHPRRSHWVFPNDAGTRPMDIRTCWDTAVKRAGLVDFHFHDLRHSCGSYLAMSGADVLTIAAILGHKKLDMAWRYIHLSTVHTSKALASMTAHIFPS